MSNFLWNRKIFVPKDESEEAISASFSSLQTAWYALTSRVSKMETKLNKLDSELDSITISTINFLGIPEYDSTVTYAANDIVRVSDTIYISQISGNIGSFPETHTSDPWDGVTAWHTVSISQLITYILNNIWSQRQ
jgi:hypothetical protein